MSTSFAGDSESGGPRTVLTGVLFLLLSFRVSFLIWQGQNQVLWYLKQFGK